MSNLQKQFQKTKQAGSKLQLLSEVEINLILEKLAQKILEKSDWILAENQKDLSLAETRDAKYERLKLDSNKVKNITESILNLLKLPNPIGQILDQKNPPNGLQIKKISVPLGVVGVIYEARPNVTPDVFSLCFKSGNGCVLKGGKDAYHSHLAFFKIIQEVLTENQIDPAVIFLMPPEREFVKDLFTAHGLVDVVIPRGSQNLINFTRQNCQIPVIETGAGVCHIFWEKTGKKDFAKKIIFNSKTSRPFACNALDTLVVEKTNLPFLAEVLKDLEKFKVQVLADKESFKFLKDEYFFVKETLPSFSYGTEFLDYKMSIKTVESFDEGLAFIQKYTSGHSESIISEDSVLAEKFLSQIDAAAVYQNTSLSFTDGGQFGLGCEIGISTQKLHARGPMGLEALTSFKWVVKSEGKIRE